MVTRYLIKMDNQWSINQLRACGPPRMSGCESTAAATLGRVRSTTPHLSATKQRKLTRQDSRYRKLSHTSRYTMPTTKKRHFSVGINSLMYIYLYSVSTPSQKGMCVVFVSVWTLWSEEMLWGCWTQPPLCGQGGRGALVSVYLGGR